jgi:hypothetical protein
VNAAYEALKKNIRKFVSLTSPTPEEFEYLLPAFEQVYRQVFPVAKKKIRLKRERKAGGGRKGALANIEQKLLFALVYQKSYPVHSIMGELFGISQSQANEWIHTLLPILKQALDDLGYEPERDPKQFKKSEQSQKDATESIDGTERQRQRPKDTKKQALYYSSKQKVHSEKNVVITTFKKKRLSYVSQTYSGKTHNKKVAETKKIAYLEHITLLKDTGFQGYEPKVYKTIQPKKAT